MYASMAELERDSKPSNTEYAAALALFMEAR